MPGPDLPAPDLPRPCFRPQVGSRLPSLVGSCRGTEHSTCQIGRWLCIDGAPRRKWACVCQIGGRRQSPERPADLTHSCVFRSTWLHDGHFPERGETFSAAPAGSRFSHDPWAISYGVAWFHEEFLWARATVWPCPVCQCPHMFAAAVVRGVQTPDCARSSPSPFHNHAPRGPLMDTHGARAARSRETRI